MSTVERLQAWPEDQLAILHQKLTDWYVWYVATPLQPGSGYVWCARPEGAEIATCWGNRPDELVKAIEEFETDLAEHIETTRSGLARIPHGEANARSRNVLELQLSAMMRLQTRRQATR
jgi:hypothetical protein